MASATNTYSAAQAAKILGISERRVRQLVSQGNLPGKRSTDGTVRIPQQAVNEERKRRKKDTPAAKATTTRTRARATAADSAVDVDSLADKVASAVGQRLEGQLEITRRAESLIRGELDEERARRMQLEAALNAAQQRVTELESQSKRGGLFRRK
jgi:excisionase family DNA binding protein